jgi:hypothetical protein
MDAVMRTYVIDNDRGYSDHSVYFVEADPAVMDPLLAAYQKAWSRTCRYCGCPYQTVPAGTPAPKCPKPPKRMVDQSWPYHSYYEAQHVLFVADEVEWRVDRRMTVAGWLDYVVGCCYLTDDVADVEAAQEFQQLAMVIAPTLYFGSFDWTLRPAVKP